METVADGNDEAAIQSATAAGRPSWTIGTKVIHRAFDDTALEELYQNYCQRSRESDLDCFFLTGCLVAVHSAVSFSLKQQDQALQSRVLIGAGVSSVVAVAQASLGFYIRGRKKKNSAADRQEAIDNGGHQQAAPAAVVTSTGRLTYAAWLLANVLILGLLAVVPSSDQGTRALTWLLLINFLTCVTLPLRLRVCLFLTSITSLLFLAVSAFTSWDEAGIHRPTLHQQVVAVLHPLPSLCNHTHKLSFSAIISTCVRVLFLSFAFILGRRPTCVFFPGPDCLPTPIARQTTPDHVIRRSPWATKYLKHLKN